MEIFKKPAVLRIIHPPSLSVEHVRAAKEGLECFRKFGVAIESMGAFERGAQKGICAGPIAVTAARFVPNMPLPADAFFGVAALMTYVMPAKFGIALSYAPLESLGRNREGGYLPGKVYWYFRVPSMYREHVQSHCMEPNIVFHSNIYE